MTDTRCPKIAQTPNLRDYTHSLLSGCFNCIAPSTNSYTKHITDEATAYLN